MKRALTFLFAVVCGWTVSFVQAANVELSFYSGVTDEGAVVVEDLHYAVVSVDGDALVKGNLGAEDKGKFDADIGSNSFYVIAEQASTKFFGSVLIEQNEAADQLFFVIDENGLTWLKDARKCNDEENCKQKLTEGAEDFCDENCVYKKLATYNAEKVKLAETSNVYAQEVEGAAQGAESSSSSAPSTGAVAGGAAGSAVGGVGATAGAGIGGALSSVAMAVAMGVAIPVAVSAAHKKEESKTTVKVAE